MNNRSLRYALALLLTIVIAACGGNGPTDSNAQKLKSTTLTVRAAPNSQVKLLVGLDPDTPMIRMGYSCYIYNPGTNELGPVLPCGEDVVLPIRTVQSWVQRPADKDASPLLHAVAIKWKSSEQNDYDDYKACYTVWTLPPPPEVCNNGVDDDWDGKVDCRDEDCRNHSSCQSDPGPGGPGPQPTPTPGPQPVCDRDGRCEAGENSSNCPGDCPVTDPCNRNGTCDAGENSSNCPGDCPVWVCGNSICEPPNETPAPGSCPTDCPGTCGDGYCNPFAGENASNCGDCPSVCGDGECTGSENSDTCGTDCPVTCGDGYCGSGELCSTDCPWTCGDGACMPPAETPTSCATDCG